MSGAVIWWIGERERGSIDENDLEIVGKYIADCFRNMWGSNECGRLWVDGRFGFVRCRWNNEWLVCQVINEARAQGIVVVKEYAHKLPKAGFFTDFECVLVDI